MTKDYQSGKALVIGVVGVLVILIGLSLAYYFTNGFGLKTESQVETGQTSGNTSSSDGDKETLPADFPSEIPIFQPSSFDSVTTTTTAGGELYMAAFTVAASKDKVVAFYDDALTKDGWKIDRGIGTGAYGADHGDLHVTIRATTISDQQVVITITTPKSSN